MLFLAEKMVKTSYGVQILLPLFLSCTAYNIVRRAIGEAAPALIDNGFFERSDYAMINTVSFILYGLSKFFTSHLVKGNYFLLYSWISTVVCVLTFLCGITCSAVYPSFHLFFVLWSINYIFIGSLWPIICIIIKQWIPDHCSELFVWLSLVRGLYWSVICCCSSVGTIICNTLSRTVSGDPKQIYFLSSCLVLLSLSSLFSLFPKDEKSNVRFYPLLPSRPQIPAVHLRNTLVLPLFPFLMSSPSFSSSSLFSL